MGRGGEDIRLYCLKKRITEGETEKEETCKPAADKPEFNFQTQI